MLGLPNASQFYLRGTPPIVISQLGAITCRRKFATIGLRQTSTRCSSCTAGRLVSQIPSETKRCRAGACCETRYPAPYFSCAAEPLTFRLTTHCWLAGARLPWPALIVLSRPVGDLRGPRGAGRTLPFSVLLFLCLSGIRHTSSSSAPAAQPPPLHQEASVVSLRWVPEAEGRKAHDGDRRAIRPKSIRIMIILFVVTRIANSKLTAAG